MELPPPTYLLLVALTLLAWPFVRLRVQDESMRRATALLLGGLLAVEAGLVLLFYSTVACAVGVAAGAALLARVGFSRSWPATAAAAAPALAAGAILVAQGEDGLRAYFAIGLPASLVAALAAAAQRWLRWASPRRVLGPLALLGAFAAMVPFSSFALRFGHLFEVWQAPVLVALLAAVAWLATRGQAAREAGRDEAPRLDGAAYAGHPGVGARLGVAASLGLLALAAVVAGLAFAHAFHAAADGPVRTAGGLARLAAGVAATLAAALAGSVALAGLLSAAARRRFHREPWAGAAGSVRLPPGALVEPGGAVSRADPRGLEAFRGRVAAGGARVGAIVMDGGGDGGPFATLPDAAAAWLEDQRGPVRIHVVVREGGDAFVVPPVLPGEGEP